MQEEMRIELPVSASLRGLWTKIIALIKKMKDLPGILSGITLPPVVGHFALLEVEADSSSQVTHTPTYPDSR